MFSSMKYLVFVIISVFIISCGFDKTDQTHVIKGYDSAQNEAVPHFQARFARLSDDVPIKQIHNVYIVKGQLVVATSTGVFCYDMEGNFIREISHKGRASNEWITVGPLIVDETNGNLEIFDTSSDKVLRFSLDGSFLGSSNLPERLFTVYQAESLPDGRTVFTHGLINDSGVLYSIEDSTYAVESSFRTYLSTDGACERIGKHPLSVHDGDIKAVFPFDNHIYSLRDNKLYPCYTIETEKRTLSRKGLREIDKFSFNEYITQSENGYFVGPNNIFETSTHILLSFFDISYILIDKGSGETLCFSPKVGSQLDRIAPIGIVNTSSDYFVGVIDVLKAKSLAEQMPDDCDGDVLLKIKEIASAPITSNPYVVLYQF